LPAVRNVLIVGAGIAGQTLAAALGQRGIRCEVVELKPAFEITGAGMYVQSNALKALADIGVVPAIVAAGYPITDDRTAIADAQGNELALIRYPRLAGPEVPAIVPIGRRMLHDILAAAVAARGVGVRMGTTIEALADRGGTVAVTFSDGTAGEFDLVVGADGVRSKVRRLVSPGTEPEYTGFANWRVVLPRPAAVTRLVWFMGRGTTFGIVPIAQDSLYIAGVSKEPGNPRYERAALVELCRARFAQYGGLARELLAQVRDPEQVVYTAIEEVHLPRPWYKGRVIVLGDAAHAGTPFWAQGGSMAIEDAVLLARLLESGTAVSAVLAEWLERRYDRCLFTQRGSLETGLRSHNEAPGAEAARLEYVRTRMQADVDVRYARLGEAF
jgi:2-polyprenyl-6-methoxyphenol hydroxylase-like FAD-dependent oxidoreductase